VRQLGAGGDGRIGDGHAGRLHRSVVNHLSIRSTPARMQGSSRRSTGIDKPDARTGELGDRAEASTTSNSASTTSNSASTTSNTKRPPGRVPPAGARREVGVQVASRRVARRGSSRTVFREGNVCSPGDTQHTDVLHNHRYRSDVPVRGGRPVRGPKFGSVWRVASRRVARRGSSRTVFREGDRCGPGDPVHTDV
jgi:hypothetical protein